MHSLAHTRTRAHAHLPRGIGLDCAAVVVAGGLGIIQHVHQERCVRRQKLCVLWRVSKGTRVPGGNVRWAQWTGGTNNEEESEPTERGWVAIEGKGSKGERRLEGGRERRD